MSILLSFPLIDGPSSIAYQQIQHTDKNRPFPLSLAVRWGRCPTTGYPCRFGAWGWLLSGHYWNHLIVLPALCLRIALRKKLTLSGQFSTVTTICQIVLFQSPWCAKNYIPIHWYNTVIMWKTLLWLVYHFKLKHTSRNFIFVSSYVDKCT